MNDPQETKRIVRIVFRNAENDKLTRYMERVAVDTPQDALRIALQFHMEQLEKIDSRKPSARLGAKQEQEDNVASFRAMNDAEATAFLVKHGYIEQPHLFNESSGEWVRYFMQTDEAGRRFLSFEYYNPETGVVSSKGDAMPLDNLIADLRKNKIL